MLSIFFSQLSERLAMKHLNTKKLLVTAGLIGALSMMAVAQAGPFGAKQGPNFERLASRLNLTEEQTPEFIEIMEAQHEKRIAIKEEIRATMVEKMDEHREEVLSAVGGILTAEQLTEMEEMMDRHGDRSKKMQHKHSFR
jgi:Spy/CpxP family protein refolding chaperone